MAAPKALSPQKLYVLSTSFAKSEYLRAALQAALDSLSSAAPLVAHYPAPAKALGRMLTGEEIISHCGDGTALLVGRETLDASTLAKLPSLKVIAKYGVGLDNLDQEAMRRQNIALAWRAGVNAPYVAEHALGLLLGLSRKIAIGSQLLHQGQWRKDGGESIHGKKVAIIGLGHTGTATAKLLKAGFGCDIRAYDILDKTAEGKELGIAIAGSLAEAVADADVISLHVPLTEKTLNMVDSQFFHSLSPGCLIINTSRGEVIDQPSLVAALDSGAVAGAGLDVFWREPEIDAPLMSHPLVVATPHTAGNSRQAVQAMGEAAIAGLVEYWASL